MDDYIGRLTFRYRRLTPDWFLLAVPGNGGRLRVVEVPQEPIACPTKQDVYVLELQHGFCRDYLKNNKNYQELHRYSTVASYSNESASFQMRMALSCAHPLSVGPSSFVE